MYIDTHSKDSMQASICAYLNTTLEELQELFDYVSHEAQQDLYFDAGKANALFTDFVQEKIPETPIDKILFFHLSRRLNSSSEPIGNNLYDLLSSSNDTTDFLKEHDVELVLEDNHFVIIHKGKRVSLENNCETNAPYLRWRLGYTKRIDYCINGFMLKDLLYKNSYARDLYYAPELIGCLASFLNRPDICIDYRNNGTYYCFEYCVPLEDVLFDDSELLSPQDKELYLLTKVLNRLHDYHTTEPNYIFDHDNPIIRLADTATMPSSYCISKEIITESMLR